MRLAILFALSMTASAVAQTAASQDIVNQRQQIIFAILTTDRPDLVDRHRWLCIDGQEPARVKGAREGGMNFTPDAADSCVAALQRSAKDRVLPAVYKTLAQKLGGDADGYQTLPKAIGAAVLSGSGQVSIGNGKATTVTPQLAFDAGFTVAYTDGAAPKQADPQKLKALAEGCLSSQKDAGTCFSVGYVYGSQAVSAR